MNSAQYFTSSPDSGCTVWFQNEREPCASATRCQDINEFSPAIHQQPRLRLHGVVPEGAGALRVSHRVSGHK